MFEARKTRCGIFSDSYEAAERILDKIFSEISYRVKFYKKNKIELNLRLKDGKDYVWIRPMNNSRSFKCSKAYVDLAIPENDILNIVCMFCDENTNIELFETRGRDYTTLSMLTDTLRKVRCLCRDMNVGIREENIGCTVYSIEKGEATI